ncbi:DapH/DapD/GlmU-related protein [Aureivirga sp. CE67]|uniref:DapH/DapD/GlmU-related protein n=1 Tax=Aureivirga sp. CE67 TaxID=1788983 RepID=UPI0018C9BDC4|nr:DapH/DapD/GlmU-related protein [Aureivirga sp. CE67]
MHKDKVSFKQKIDYLIFGKILTIAYPKFIRPKYGYCSYFRFFLNFFIPQKLLRINAKVKWPVHYTSKVVCPENITKGIMCDPGDNHGNYIQASNGIEFGSNIEFGPGVKIISSNHDLEDFTIHVEGKPIKIGNFVWIGANTVILPEVEIGDNVIIGAGSVVTKSIPSNSVAVGNPCKVIREKAPYKKDISNVVFNQKSYLK